MTSRTKKPKRRLLTHRSVAELIDVDTATLRDWVARGEWPEPVAVISQTWFYDAEVIEHWIETGQWLPEARFKIDAGRGRALARDQADEDSA